MKALVFDQSLSNTGWAFGTENSSNKEGANDPYRTGLIKVPKRDNIGERLAILWRAMNAIAIDLQPDVIAFEEPFFPVDRGKPQFQRASNFRPASGFLPAEIEEHQGDDEKGGAKFNPETIRALQKVAGMIEMMAALRGIPCFGYHPSQWRVTLLGYGRKPKGAEDDFMKKATLRQLKAMGFEVTSHDVGDAIGILYHTLHGKDAIARRQGDIFDMLGDDL